MATALPVLAPVTERPRLGPLALWAMLGFCAGLPFFMFSTVLALRLAEHGVGLVVPTLFVVQLAFWTTTLEVAADGWRCEFAPTPEARVPIVAANLWGYRPAMVAANGMAGAVFVVYLSMLVNPRWPGAQYALLSGFAFLLPRLLAGASGSMQARVGYDGFFLLSGALSLAAILLLPLIARLRPREDDR